MTEKQYIKFLKDVYVTDSGNHLSPASVNKYSCQTTSKIDSYLKTILPNSSYDSIYDADSIEELKEIRSRLMQNSHFLKENTEGHNMYSSGLNRYIEFAEGTLISQFQTDTSVLDIKEPIPKNVEIQPRRVPLRDSVKIAQAKGACRYCCQISETHISFTSEYTKRNYVEGHHIIPIRYQSCFKYSLDVLANIIVLCPNCHRLLHYAIKAEKKDRLFKIYDDRYERFSNAGILVDRPSFIEMAMETID